MANIQKMVFAICFFAEFEILRFKMIMQPQAGEPQDTRRSKYSYPKIPSQVTMYGQDQKSLGKKTAGSKAAGEGK